MDKKKYLQHVGTTVNHFYEKLFLLTELLNTDMARKIAEKGQLFMEQFLDGFFAELKGEF